MPGGGMAMPNAIASHASASSRPHQNALHRLQTHLPARRPIFSSAPAPAMPWLLISTAPINRVSLASFGGFSAVISSCRFRDSDKWPIYNRGRAPFCAASNRLQCQLIVNISDGRRLTASLGIEIRFINNVSKPAWHALTISTLHADSEMTLVNAGSNASPACVEINHASRFTLTSCGRRQ